jgi:hypothetical protein
MIVVASVVVWLLLMGSSRSGHFIVVIAASKDLPRIAPQELSGRDSPARGEEHLRTHIHASSAELQRQPAGMDDDRPCASVSAQTVLGGVLGGNLAFYTMITSITGL